jgi:hypothetical protein
LHVIHSHFATVDVPLTFFTTLVLVFSLSALRSGSLKHFLLAAVASGAAASVKYSGLSSIVLPLALLLFPNKDFSTHRRLAFAVAIPAVALLTFLATCPFSLLSPQEFLTDVRFELSHLAKGGTAAFLNTPPAPIYHLANSLPNALGPLFLVASLLGFLLALRRPQREEWPLLLWTVLSFLTASLSHEKFIRYILPLLPCLAILAVRLANVKRRPWRSLALILLAVSGFSAFLLSFAHLRYLILPDARAQAAEWVLARTPKGAAIGIPEFPWFFTPPITPYNGGKKLSGKDFLAWNLASPHPVLIAEWPPLSKNYWEPEAFAPNPPQFILLSDIEVKNRLRAGDLQTQRFLAFLHSNYRRVAQFGSKPSLFGLRLVGKYPPPDWEYHDPIVWIYERRD